MTSVALFTIAFGSLVLMFATLFTRMTVEGKGVALVFLMTVAVTSTTAATLLLQNRSCCTCKCECSHQLPQRSGEVLKR